jgi:hypothetical protein
MENDEKRLANPTPLKSWSTTYRAHTVAFVESAILVASRTDFQRRS